MTPATKAAAAAGVAHRLHEYDHDGALPSRPAGRAAPAYGLEAAEKLGVDPARVFKTLVADVDGRPGGPGVSPRCLVVAVVPVAGRLDLKALAAAAGGKRAALADTAAAERATGYVVGGISPLAQRTRLPTVLDVSMLAHAEVLVSAGRRGLDIELAPGDLARLTGGTFAPITTA